MKLMITGAGGLLGSRLTSYYKDRYEILSVTHRELDFTDMKQVTNKVQKFDPDVIIHCGAISDVSACEKNPALSMAVNVNGTGNLARAAALTDARFVYCSSDQVYMKTLAPENPAYGSAAFLTPHKETEVLSPQVIYGQHKLLAEQLCIKEQPDSVILRLTWMYDRLTQQELKRGRSNLFTILDNAIRMQSPLSFSVTDYRGVTDMRRVVSQMEKAWQLPAGIYNFGSGSDTNMYAAMEKVLTVLQKKELLLEPVSSNLRNLTMNTDKIELSGIHFPDTVTGILSFFREHME